MAKRGDGKAAIVVGGGQTKGPSLDAYVTLRPTGGAAPAWATPNTVHVGLYEVLHRLCGPRSTLYRLR